MGPSEISDRLSTTWAGMHEFMSPIRDCSTAHGVWQTTLSKMFTDKAGIWRLSTLKEVETWEEFRDTRMWKWG